MKSYVTYVAKNSNCIFLCVTGWIEGENFRIAFTISVDGSCTGDHFGGHLQRRAAWALNYHELVYEKI